MKMTKIDTQMSAIALVTAMSLIGCSRKDHTTDDAGAAPPSPMLPAPYADVRLGMTETELRTLFPPMEDVSKCAPQLVGGDAALPIQIPGAEKKARARCVRALDVAGMTSGELRAEEEWMTGTVNDGAAHAGRDPADYREGSRYTIAQVRGSVRAGTLPEAALLEANHGKSNTAFGAVVVVADALYNGAFEYARSTNTRRTLCALLSDSCDDLDPSRVRTYEAGGYGLGQIDADAHSRVVYGKCRTQYLQGEKKVQMKLVRRAGGLAGFGLARASTADHSVNPADPTTFTVYSSRSKLDAPVAKVGVLIGNALPQTERFWSGAVTLIPADSGASSDWGTAVAWLRDGRVVRLMLNIVSDSNLGELPGALNTVYGSPGSTAGPVTSWKLNDGGEARLDIGAALSLVVESPAARMASAPTALSAAPAASAGPVAPTLPSVTASPSDRSGPGPTKLSKRPASPAVSSTPDPFGGPDPLPSEPAAKKKGNCGCASGDMMCAMKCSSR